MNVLTFSLLLPLIYIVNAQIEIPGACPANAVQSNFNISAYLGKWYEIKRYQTSFQQSGDCVTAQYALNSDNATISVVNQMTILPNKTAILSINGTGRLQSTEPPIDGRLFVNFFGNESDYWVLNTDYNNYAVVWSCANFGNNSMQSSWILSRTRTLTPEIEKKVNALFPSFHLNDTLFRVTEQSEKMCVNSASMLKLMPAALVFIVTLFSQALHY